jgi:hypothetical protein
MRSSVAVPGSGAQPDNQSATLVTMTVLVWVTEESWMACVDATLVRASADEVTLLHVTDAGATDAAQGAFSALLGRGGAGRPGSWRP